MTQLKGKKRRSIYPYTCMVCGKDRLAFKYQRAAAALCTKCEEKVSENQDSLFV